MLIFLNKKSLSPPRLVRYMTWYRLMAESFSSIQIMDYDRRNADEAKQDSNIGKNM